MRELAHRHFPLAFAIATLVVVLLLIALLGADRLLKLSKLFADLGG